MRIILKLCITLTFILAKQIQTSAVYFSSCITPQDEDGTCVPVKSCSTSYETLLDIRINESENYTNDERIPQLRAAYCGFFNMKYHICCSNTAIQLNPQIIEYLSNLKCGRSSTRKIARGDVAQPNQFRWMALLKYKEKPIFRCSGSLISERYVLTAAHCFGETPVAVRLGEYNIDTEIDTISISKSKITLPPYEDIGIEDIIIPDGYRFGSLYNDIALIRLESKVEFKRYIVPICLPITKELRANEPPIYQVAGWGRTETAKYSPILLYANIPGKSRELCEEKLPLSGLGHLNSGHICAGGEEFRDSCKGDSGSPLFSVAMYVNEEFKTVQFGIVSIGISSCGERSLPAVYTNVSHYMQWITDNMLID